jgi:hypothetical protein
MRTCTRCGQSRRDELFRRKANGPLAGYVFPVCMPCDQEIHLEGVADSLRSSGYTCTRTTTGGAR